MEIASLLLSALISRRFLILQEHLKPHWVRSDNEVKTNED